MQIPSEPQLPLKQFSIIYINLALIIYLWGKLQSIASRHFYLIFICFVTCSMLINFIKCRGHRSKHDHIKWFSACEPISGRHEALWPQNVKGQPCERGREMERERGGGRDTDCILNSVSCLETKRGERRAESGEQRKYTVLRFFSICHLASNALKVRVNMCTKHCQLKELAPWMPKDSQYLKI